MPQEGKGTQRIENREAADPALDTPPHSRFQWTHLQLEQVDELY